MARFESNIGLAKVEYLRLFKNKPHFFLLWGGLALLFLAMAFVHKIGRMNHLLKTGILAF